LHLNEQEINRLEGRLNATAEVAPPENDLLVVHAGEATSDLNEICKSGAIFAFPFRIRRLVRQGDLGTAEREPIGDDLAWVREADLADLATKLADDLGGARDSRYRDDIDALAAVRGIDAGAHTADPAL
jgi:hypothetical protein